jgi:BirA family biotin operon repressor/biotin-[acetyl-CoA-carboxylase] ligase
MNFNILRFDSVDSTNLEAIRQARKGADEGCCIVAREQTAGRGRKGRTWTSSRDAGLYISIVLRPEFELTNLPLISLAAAIAVHDTLADFGLDPDIKWPNDVLIREKKICGILAETTDSDRGIAVIVGIGINLTSDSFPEEIADTATSIEAELDVSIPTAQLESSLLQNFADVYQELSVTNGPATIVDEWSARSSYVRGKTVKVTLAGETIIGPTDGLGSDGGIRIRTNNGSVRIVHAGDVQHIRPSERN